MSVYENKKEWNKWNEMVSASLNAIEDFRDFSDDIAIVRADKKIQSLITKKYNLERKLEEAREAYEFNLDLLSEKERKLEEAREFKCPKCKEVLNPYIDEDNDKL